jgi:hypothetical protein
MLPLAIEEIIKEEREVHAHTWKGNGQLGSYWHDFFLRNKKN